jgi:putative phage-type endonuclease
MRPWGGLKFISFNGVEDWLSVRQSIGIGGSESASILGMSPYKCSAQLFYEKLGLASGSKTSLPMIIGLEDEDKIARLWSYYDRNLGVESIPTNYSNKNVVRNPVKLSKILVNPRYPHLFANVDRFFFENGKRSILELKTINHWESQKWESGVPIHYIIQIQHYMLVCGVDYAELAILESNSKIDIIPLEASKEIQDRIVDKTEEFWRDLCAAKDILANGGIELDIQHLVPPPDGSDAYTEFLKDKYKDSITDNESVTTANLDDLDTLREFIRLKEEQEKLGRELALREQRLRDRMGEHPILDFGDQYGKITWRADKNGKRAFKTNGVRKEAVLSESSVEL